MNGRRAALSPAFAVFTPLMKSREPRAGWFAFATDVDAMRIVRWRLHRELAPVAPGEKPRERLKLDESSCPLDAPDGDDDGNHWTRPELLGYPADVAEAGAIVVARFERLTTFRLESEVPG